MFVATLRRCLLFGTASLCLTLAAATVQAQETLWDYPASFGSIQFSQDGKYAWTTVADSSDLTKKDSVIWEMPAATKLSSWQARSNATSQRFLNDGERLLQVGHAYTDTNQARNEGRVIEMKTGKTLVDVDVPKQIHSVIVTKNDQVYLFSHLQGWQFDPKNGEQKQVMDVPAGQVALMPNSGLVLVVMDPTGELQDYVYVFNSMADYLAKRKPRHKIGPFEMAKVTPAPNEKVFVVENMKTGADGLELESLSCFDVQRGQKVAEYQLKNPSGIGEPVYFSADGHWVVTGDQPTITVFDVAKKEGKEHADEMRPVGFTPGDALIMTGYAKPFKFLDPATYQPLETPLDAKWLTPSGKK